MISHRCLTVLAVGALFSGPASAQRKPETAPATYLMPKEYREVQKSALETQRKLFLSFADSMPERLYRDRATPAQRDFAQQIYHAVSTVSGSALTMKGEKFREPDSTNALNNRAALKALINREYDAAEAIFAAQSDADRNLRVKAGPTYMPKWQLWDELNQHSMWTAGQIVANFRKNGMAPPGFLFF
jgi:hypothetical protein